jgi:hypothetical protein
MDGFGVAAKAYGYQAISLSTFSPRVQCRAPPFRDGSGYQNTDQSGFP